MSDELAAIEQAWIVPDEDFESAEGLTAKRDIAVLIAEIERLRLALVDYDSVAQQAIKELGHTDRSKVEFEELISDAVAVLRATRKRWASLRAAAAVSTGRNT